MSTQLAVFIDFENIAIWARQEFFDFELTPLIEYLQSRGSLVIKRAYADWGHHKEYLTDLHQAGIEHHAAVDQRGHPHHSVSVTLLTRSSVHCAERMVATNNCHGLS